MILRDANIEDLETLEWWDLQAHIVDSIPGQYKWSRELKRKPEWRKQLIAEQNGRKLGFVQIIDPSGDPNQYWGRQVHARMRAVMLWIGESYDLGKGYGSTIMNMVIERCFDEEIVNEILVDPLASNSKTQSFYTRLGFKFSETRELGGELCYVMKLKRQQYECD